MDMILIEILQLNCYAVPELPPSRNPLHNCTLACIVGITTNHDQSPHSDYVTHC